ncbi:MAG: helix-turn-helix domain-containing protein [Thermomicrobiales bacterium]
MQSSASARPRLYRKDLFNTPRHSIRVSRHILADGFLAHDHDFLEIALIGGGRGIHHTVHGPQTLAAGDAFIIRPNAWHAFQQCRELVVCNICIGLDLLEGELRWVRNDPALAYLLWSGPVTHERGGIVGLRLSTAAQRVCQQHFQVLLRLQEDAAPSAHIERIGTLLLILGHLARDMGPAHRAASARTPALHRAVLEGIRLLQAHLDQPWTLPVLAARLAIDPAYLVRLFKAQTGLPPLAYLARHRAERAAMLLLQTDRPIAQIGAAVGWDDPNYFARRFRAYFGVSATTYRARFSALASPVAPPAPPVPSRVQTVAD